MAKQQNLMALISLSLLVLIDAMSFGIVIPLFAPLFMDPQHSILAPNASDTMRQSMYALVFCIPLITILIGSPLLGSLSDRWGRKKVLIIGLSGVLISFMLMYISIELKSLALLMLSRALLGLSDGTQSIAQAAVVDISNPQNKAKNMSFISAASTLGFMFGPMLGGFCSASFLSKLFGYGAPYVIANLAILTNIALLVMSFKETGKIRHHEQKIKLTDNLKELIYAFIDKRILRYSTCFIALQLLWSSFFEGTIMLLSKNFHYNSISIGWYTSFLSSIFTVSLMILSKQLLKILSSRQCAMAGFVLLGVGALACTVAFNSIMGIYLVTIPICVGVAMTYNTLLALFSDAVDEDEQGRTMGISVALSAISWTIGSGIVALEVNHFAVIVSHIILAMIIFMGFYLLFQSKERSEYHL
ncbi:MAG: hypothetical protein A3F17_03855 [Gammaproteobacteria bacterium RIFCSPHIGHO2_12_FULL_41_15]|nr:MAG: hypothetical protein A3F17_03855 [Gammaproteobacteria bacterium RIFCSPHIGHO2_12_FULL_41_15]